MESIKIGVRDLVEFVLRSGNIDTGFFSKDRMLEGAQIHRKIQGLKSDNYQAEYYLKIEVEYEELSFIIDGRADGVELLEDKVTIDEIKSTSLNLEEIDENHNILHWAQSKIYSYMYCALNSLEDIDVQLTYVSTDTLETKLFTKTFMKSDLYIFFFDILERYSKWAHLKRDWDYKRTQSLCSLNFPFDTYRNGQRDMAASVYNTISRNKKLYVCAPTGIGKTVSTIFPSLKAMGEQKCEKIFYLTAKEITRDVVENTVLMLQNNSAKIKSVTITAKSKICFLDEPNCNPIDCKYASGHFDRVNDALMDILQNEIFISKQQIIEYSKRYNICPYEFSLDISQWSDIVICDYNYIFDPRVKIKRYLADEVKKPFVYLVDEAHNLLDRAREMYSAQVDKQSFMELKKVFDKKSVIYKHTNNINKYFIELRKDYSSEKCKVFDEELSDITALIVKWINLCEKWLKQNISNKEYKKVLDAYFNSLAYVKMSELYGDEYCTIVNVAKDNVYIKMFCLNPSRLLEKCFDTGIASVIFSATLFPLSYYYEILGGNDDDFFISIPSPFKQKNLCLLCANTISTKYNDRENTYSSVVDMIYTTVSNKTGNYIVYFPSYIYMNKVHEIFADRYNDIKTIRQSSAMGKGEQQEFIDSFISDNTETLIGFCVLGGVFSEGIDLTGNKLYGTVIVGVGIPQVNVYQNVIKEYFENTRGDGFSYAYTYPGFNKVMQAAGRVIRTSTDRGVVLLIDQRFSYQSYQRLFPKHWHHIKYIGSYDELGKCLEDFNE